MFRSAFIVAAFGLFVGIVAWGGSKFLKKAWRAETNIMIVKDTDRNSLASVAGQLGGVAALLGGATGGNDVNEALATLRSRLLVAEFLAQEKRLDQVVDVMTDGNRSDLGEKSDVLNKAVDFFQKQILTVSYDTRSGLVSVVIVWGDRQVAADWANAYVAMANELMRRRAITEARDRIKYLREAADNAETVDLRGSIYSLLESQIRTEMLASTRPEFGFRVFDPAVVPRMEQKVRPKSALIGVVGTIIGGAIGAGFVMLRRRRRAASP